MDPFHFWYSVLGLLVGSFFLASGVFCLAKGRSGRATMSVKMFGTTVEISTSVPGLIFAALGLLVIVATR